MEESTKLSEAKPRKAGRPKGAPNKKPYPMTSAAYHQRSIAALKHGKKSTIFNQIIKQQEGLNDAQQKALEEFRLDLWKKFDTPSLMLMDEYATFRTLVAAKQLSTTDATSKDIRECLRLLLDISKEINRLSTVSADKKFDAFTKNAYDDDFEMEMNDVEVEVVDE